MEESSNVKKVGAGGKNALDSIKNADWQKNMSGADKNIRLGAGGALFLVGIFGSKLWMFLGLALLATVYFGICPAYTFLKHSTLGK